MKRILYLSNALKPLSDKLKFALYLCHLTGAGMKAIFHVDQQDEPQALSWINHAAMNAGIPLTENISVLKQQLCDKNINQFKSACDREGIRCSTRRSEDNFLEEVILESRYTDLILLDIEIAFSFGHISIPTHFAEDVLRSAACPVISLPEAFNTIEELVFTYDGKISSMYAMKQFTYLFPQLSSLKVTVVTVNPEITTAADRYKFIEWLHANYSNVNYFAIEGDERRSLLEILLQRKNCLILMGAYGKSKFSSLFRSSHASDVLKMTSQPVFIVHP